MILGALDDGAAPGGPVPLFLLFLRPAPGIKQLALKRFIHVAERLFLAQDFVTYHRERT